jgi:hypothetical protein
LDSELIQGVFQTYTGRRWKAWEYRGWVEEGLLGEMEDPFEAVKMAAGIGWGRIFAQTQRSFGIKESSGLRITDRRETGQLLERS